jgi:hypothetical protein
MPDFTLEALAARIEAVERKVAELSQSKNAPVATTAGVTTITGVDPAEVWEAHAQADAGRLTPHHTVFENLRGRS